jgi:NAD(P)-dependent dehydrogenase (short-subunit alcohol dehydrogenase family)
MALVIITGAAGGIGAATARAAAAQGHRLALWDFDADGAARLAADLPDATAQRIDVTDPASVEAAFATLDAPPDALVNNAGIVDFRPLAETTTAQFARVIDVNLTGAYTVAREAALRMIPRGAGAIVNVTSIGGISMSPGTNAYAPAKAGLAALTELMALEWAPLGLRVNSIAPGMIDGGMAKGVYENPDTRARRTAGIPARRLGTVEDVAQAILWLISPASDYVNGHQLVVDGALTKAVLAMVPR